MPFDDVHDSTDWLATPLAALADVEAALRCQVCKDFYRTPMITSCSHTFCSLCIRRALSNDGKCPLCRASEQEMKLRSNWSMEETVDAFTKARPKALDVARNGIDIKLAAKRKQNTDVSGFGGESEPKRLRMSARLSKNRQQTEEHHAQEQSPDEVVIDATDDSNDEIQSDGGTGAYQSPSIPSSAEAAEPDAAGRLVPCPSCQKRMKAWQVFQHLETCSGPTPTLQNTVEPAGRSVLLQAQARQNAKTLERLPAVNYSMLKEQALRKKLSEIGISNQGPRNLLERRHKEWITLWNANCDSANPKKRSQLHQDLDVWEKTQGIKAMTGGKGAQTAAAIKEKDFDGVSWASKHESSFKDLIASARKSRLEAKQTPAVEHRSEQPDTDKSSIGKSQDEPIEVLGKSRVDMPNETNPLSMPSNANAAIIKAPSDNSNVEE